MAWNLSLTGGDRQHHVSGLNGCTLKAGTDNTYVKPDGTEITITTQGVFGDTWFIGKWNTPVTNWLNQDLAGVGRETFITVRSPDGKITGSHYRTNARGDMLVQESDVKLSNPQAIQAFNEKKDSMICGSALHNGANKLLIPLGVAGLVAGSVAGGVYVAGTEAFAATCAWVASTAGTMGAALSRFVAPVLSRMAPLASRLRPVLQAASEKAAEVLPKLRPMAAAARNFITKTVPKQLTKLVKLPGARFVVEAVKDIAKRPVIKPVINLAQKIWKPIKQVLEHPITQVADAITTGKDLLHAGSQWVKSIFKA